MPQSDVGVHGSGLLAAASPVRLIHCLCQDCFLVLLAPFITDQDSVTLKGELYWTVDRQFELLMVVENIAVTIAVDRVSVAIVHLFALDGSADHVNGRDLTFLPFRAFGPGRYEGAGEEA